VCYIREVLLPTLLAMPLTLVGGHDAVGFEFSAGPRGGSSSSSGTPGACMLMGMGPKLLTSDLSTAGGRVLRW
jgi:hypothetical protein